MSYLSPKPDQSTDSEVLLLTGLNDLAISAAGEFIRKTGVATFANATPSEAGLGTVTLVSSANGAATVATGTTTPVITIVSAPILTTARTIGGVSFDGSANITVATATGGFTVSGGNLALGTNSITMSGSIAATGTRVTKGWFTDVESTNMYTVGGTSIASTFAPIASPTFTGTVTTPAEILNGQVNLDGTPASDHSAVGPVTNTFQAGYSSAIGDLVFMGSGGKWLEVDADAVATCNGLMGIALEAKTDTQAMLVALPGSFVRDDSWNWTVGATLYAGETLGLPQEAIPTGADAIIKVIGFAVTADVMFFNPSSDQQSVVA